MSEIKKILFISDNYILGYGGGSIENKKHYENLKKICLEKKYILKTISPDNFENESLFSICKNKKIDILSRILFHSSYLYIILLKNKKKILKFNPDILYLGRSRFGFFASFFKKRLPSCKIITNIDNVEYDYVDAYFSKNSGIVTRIKKSYERFVVHKDEISSIKNTDFFLSLTNRNIERYKQLYNFSSINYKILPICLDKKIELTLKENLHNIVFIGSLNYASNIVTVEKILEMLKYINGTNLIVAGRNPSNELKTKLKSYANVYLYENFKELNDIVPRYSLMLAPIEKGTGMKVKVAEALSMGLMIAASEEALVGYEYASSFDKLNAINQCNDFEQYIEVIKRYSNLSVADLQNIENQNKNIFSKLYAYNIAYNVINETICTIESGDIIDEKNK